MKSNWRNKAGYGAADFGLSGAELMLQLYLLEFYITAVGLSPMLAGIALGLAVLWDAVSDPLMGILTDRTRSRFGRFAPWMFLGALLFGVSFYGLFHPPEGAGQGVLFGYLLLCYLVVNTATTLMGVPHMALAAALAKHPDERTTYYGWRLIFGTFGLFAGILAPLAYAWSSGNGSDESFYAANRGGGAVWMLSAVIFFMAITLLSTYRSQRDLKPETSANHQGEIPWHQGIFDLLKNRLFLPLFLAFLLVAAGRAMNATLALPFYKVRLELPEEQIQGVILSVFTLFIVLSVPFWTYISKRFGKKWPAFCGLLSLGLMTAVAYPLFPPGQLVGPTVVAILGGLAVGAIILFESLVADIARLDSQQSGRNREGLYFGYWRMGQKVMRSISLGFTGLLLGWIGYEEGVATQSPEVAQRLAWVFGPGVGTLFILAAVVFLWMPGRSDSATPR